MSTAGVKETRVKFCLKASVHTVEREDLGQALGIDRSIDFVD